MGGQDARRVAFITDSGHMTTSPEQAQKVFERNIVPMILRFIREGRHVVVVEQVPEQFNFDTRKAFYETIRTGTMFKVEGVKSDTSAAYLKSPNVIIDSLAAMPGVSIIDPSSIFCSKKVCDLERDGKILYRDENHLSIAGAMAMEPLFTKIFERMHGIKP